MLPGLSPAALPLAGPGMAGLDEAGRGCLAGPVAAAAVILPDGFSLDGLTDSKKLTAAERERFAPLIRERSLAWGIGAVWPRRIDRINILQASLEAMVLAAASLRRRPFPLSCSSTATEPSPKTFWLKLSAAAPTNRLFPGRRALSGATA